MCLSETACTKVVTACFANTNNHEVVSVPLIKAKYSVYIVTMEIVRYYVTYYVPTSWRQIYEVFQNSMHI